MRAPSEPVQRVSLIGRTVRVPSPDLLLYFYPGFVLRDSISIVDRDKRIVYVGRVFPDMERVLTVSTRSYISTSGVPTVDLTSKGALVDFVFAKFSRKPSKAVAESIPELSDREVLWASKVFWVTGQWPFEAVDNEESIYSLFDSMIKSSQSCLSTFFAVSDTVPFPVLESSFLTFLGRAASPDDQTVRPGYLRLLKTFQGSLGAKVRPALLSYASRNDVDPCVKFLRLLLDIKS